MDYGKIIKQIKEVMKKVGTPLTEDQEASLAGCLAVYLDQAFNAGKQSNYCKECGYLNAQCVCDEF